MNFINATLACDDDSTLAHKIIQILLSEFFHIVSLNNRMLVKPIEMSNGVKAQISDLKKESLENEVA